MARGAGWRPSPVAMVSVLGAAAACVAVGLGAHDADRTTVAHRAAPETPAARPMCRLAAGETAAFKVASTVVAEGTEDRFEGHLSWIVESTSARTARVRAAFSDVVLEQALTRAEEQAQSPDGAFFLTIGRDCSVDEIAYPPTWDARTRMLVQTQLDNLAFALPPTPAPRWSAANSDGLGPYTALYRVASRAPLTITRRKTAHAPRGLTKGFGIDVRVDGAEAVAVFDPARPAWWRRVSGRETVTIETDGQDAVTLQQRFSAERDDTRFAPVPSLDYARAETQSPYTMAVTHAEPATRFSTSSDAWDAFAAAVAAGHEHDAALALAAWLRAHPDDVEGLLTRLTTGADPTQHAAVFLALELSGVAEAREALMTLVDHAALSPLDQARAALALANHGAPSALVMDRLLARADGEGMAAGVSLLGAGTLAGRADDAALRAGLVDALTDRLDVAEGTDANVVLDAMGNSGDPAFAETLDAALDADAVLTRRHAATALGRLPAEAAAPRLIERLGSETAPRVTKALVDALAATGDRSAAALAAMQARLPHAAADERAAIIEWLGRARDAETREVLVAQFHREPNARLKQHIGRFVPATALR